MMEDKRAPITSAAGNGGTIEVPATEANIAGIESVTPSANSNQVQIKHNTLQPQILNGSSDDPRIRQLLVLAARITRNPAVALDSIDVLTRGSEDAAVREVLIEALRYDKKPGVRVTSLVAVKVYVRDDVHGR